MFRILNPALVCFFACMIPLKNLWAAPPTQPSRDLTFSHQDGHTFSVSFTKGNGACRIVIARLEQPVTSVPVDGKDYNHNNKFGSGDELNAGEFVVYDGDLSGFFMSGLAPASRYHFAVFEYNGSGFATEYLTQPFAVGNFATFSAPTVQITGLNVTELNGNSVKINWINGNGSRRLVVMREASPIQVNPQDLVAYNGRPDFGNGSQLAPGTFAVAFTNQQNIQSVNVSELQPNTTYYVKAFEANGSNGPVFQPAAAPEITFTTLARPTVAAKDLVAASPDGNVVSIAWKNGNGSRRMVVVREGQPHTAVPQDGMDYAGNDNFSNAPEMAPGHIVIYHTNGFQWLNMTGAKPGTTYYFRIYESSGTGNRTTYRVIDAPTGAFSTSSPPDVAPSGIAFSQATPGSVIVGYTPGNGTGRLVLAKAGGPVTQIPENLAKLNSSQQFGSGQDLGDGNFVLNFGANTQTTVLVLTPGITYHYAVFEYSGNQARVYNTQPARGSFTQPTRPTIPSTNLVLSQIDVTQFRLTWTFGNGQRRLVILRKGAPVTFIPADGQEYYAHNNFGQSADLGQGHKAVYFGISGVVDITGLEPGTQYHISIFEAANFGPQVTYLTQLAPSATGTTLGPPAQGPQSFSLKSVNPTSANLSIVPGSGTGTLWVMRQGAPVSILPQDMVQYNANGSFGSANTELGNGHFLVHQRPETGATITNLQPGTTYHVAALAYNGANLKVFNRQQVLHYSFTTPFRPDVPSATPSFPIVDAGSMRITCTPGNGTGRIVVVRAGLPVDAKPVDGVVYNASLRFDIAPELAPGQRVVYNGNSGIADIAGLTFGTTYHFSIFEYTRVEDRIEYRAVQPASGAHATLSAPTIQASAGRATSVGATTATLGWTNGNGANRMVVLRKGNPVEFVPAHYKLYSHSPLYTSAPAQPDGSRIVALSEGTQVNVSGLEAGTTYHGAVFEYNGNATPALLTNEPAKFSFTTIDAPAESSSDAMANEQQQTSLRLSWKKGSGQRRLVVMRANLPVNAVPQDNQRYAANSFFGGGIPLQNGNNSETNPNYVVYNGEGQEVIITNLRPDVQYHVAIIEFNDFGNSVLYQQQLYHTAIVSSANPLPLVLGSFKAQVQEGKVLLDWTTHQEHNTAYFAIEVKKDAGNFIQLDKVNASGYSNLTKAYQYLHRNVGTGSFQYRLRMVDKDGTFTYSPIASLYIKGLTKTTWYVQGQNIQLQLGYIPLPGTVISVYSIEGKKVHEQKAAQQQIDIHMGNQPKGVYIILIQDKNGTSNISILW